MRHDGGLRSFTHLEAEAPQDCQELHRRGRVCCGYTHDAWRL